MYEDLLGEKKLNIIPTKNTCAWGDNKWKCRDYEPQGATIDGCCYNSKDICGVKSKDSLITNEECE